MIEAVNLKSFIRGALPVNRSTKPFLTGQY